MIQRVQTIWLILSAIAVFLSIKFSFYSGTLLIDNTFHVLTGSENILLLLITCALGTIIVIDIFLYKQRSTQIKIVILAIILECLVIFLYFKQLDQYSEGNFSLTAALHAFVLLFLFLAARGIYRDSKLVKESNRLR